MASSPDSIKIITGSDTSTEYTAEEDGRRSSRRRQLLSAAEKEGARFENLVHLIRSGRDAELGAVIDSIRQTESLDEVRGRLDQWALQSSTTASPTSLWSPSTETNAFGEAKSSTEATNTNRDAEATSKLYQSDQSQRGRSVTRSWDQRHVLPIVQPAMAGSEQGDGMSYKSPASPSFSNHSGEWHPILNTDPHQVNAGPDLQCLQSVIPKQQDSSEASQSRVANASNTGVDSRQRQTQNHQPGLATSFGNMPISSAIKSNWFPASIQQQQLLLLQKPIWALRPMSINDGSAFCRAYMSFLEVAEATFNAGHVDRLMGQDRLNVDLFFRPQFDGTALNVCEAVSLLLADFPGSAVERLAWVISTVKFITVNIDSALYRSCH
jgi:hypothetical protein